MKRRAWAPVAAWWRSFIRRQRMECCSSWCSINSFGKDSILTSTRKALIAAAIAILFSAGLIFWQVKARRVGPVELTPEDMALIAEDQPAQMRARLASDEA